MRLPHFQWFIAINCHLSDYSVLNTVSPLKSDFEVISVIEKACETAIPFSTALEQNNRLFFSGFFFLPVELITFSPG